MDNQELIEEIEKGMVNTYSRLPRVIKKEIGSLMFDVEDEIIINFLSNYGSRIHHPKIIKALQEQAETLGAVSNAIYHTGLLFAGELADFCGYEKALLMNVGAEAIERIIKIVRKYGYSQMGIPRNELAKIITVSGAFHGRTYGAGSASDGSIDSHDFGPLLPGFIKIPFGNSKALKQTIKRKRYIAAVLMEPIQAEAGVNVPSPGYLAECKEICQEAGILFCLDEIQTGFGRTGKMFCWQHENAKPDIMAIGKAIGAGLIPVSAVVGNKDIIDIFEPGQDGSTYAGYPLACAVGSAVLRVIQETKLDEQAAIKGEVLMAKLRAIKSDYIKEIRGKGLLIGIELKPEAGGAQKLCKELGKKHRLFVKEAHENVIRLEPALDIPLPLIDLAAERIKKVLEK